MFTKATRTSRSSWPKWRLTICQCQNRPWSQTKRKWQPTSTRTIWFVWPSPKRRQTFWLTRQLVRSCKLTVSVWWMSTSPTKNTTTSTRCSCELVFGSGPTTKVTKTHLKCWMQFSKSLTVWHDWSSRRKTRLGLTGCAGRWSRLRRRTTKKSARPSSLKRNVWKTKSLGPSGLLCRRKTKSSLRRRNAKRS